MREREELEGGSGEESIFLYHQYRVSPPTPDIFFLLCDAFVRKGLLGKLLLLLHITQGVINCQF